MTILVPERIRALIFDCDGTLVDSMPLHMQAWEHAVTLQGGVWDYGFFFSRKGKREEDIVAEYDRHFGLSLDPVRTVEIKHEYFHSHLDTLRPVGRVEDLARKYHGVLPMAVASGSTRQIVMLELDTLHLSELFDVVVTADDEVEAKPSPDIFLEAARRLGVESKDCQVFEDGDLGLAAARSAGMLATDIRLGVEDIHLRDPFVLYEQDQYYLYGTRGETVMTEADGFDGYTSADLVAWEGPYEVFHRDPDFWADRKFWAPEYYSHKGAYYLFATFGAEDGRMGVQVLKAESPLGPFQVWSEGPVTPADWECLDGTLYFDGAGVAYLVFSRSFSRENDGGMYAAEMTPDLRATKGEPRLLFRAKDAPWAVPFPFAKDFGIEEDVYLSDGSFLYRTQSGKLLLLWSSFGPGGYTVGIARSESGDIWGPWEHDEKALFDGDGGHCMVFRSKQDQLLMALHWPNTFGAERPRFIELIETDDGLALNREKEIREGDPLR